jgi:propane monooxygenase large subunit
MAKMTSTLTLNKITAQKGISVADAAKKIADLGWNPSYVQEAMTFPTDYKITKAPKDPMKQVLRSYFPMQEEKDNRVYGALDAALRGDMFRNVEPRWVEWMKLFLAIIPFPEISAARSMAMVGRLAPGEDLRTGFTMQMVDEFRHSTIQMNLKKWYMENYIDPAGFDITEEAFGKCYATTIGRQFGEGFITGDAITSANVYLTVVAETAFTNTLFVAMPSEAARNGDYALPTVFLSVQSDESRHVGNGHSMLMSMLKEPENHLLLERDCPPSALLRQFDGFREGRISGSSQPFRSADETEIRAGESTGRAGREGHPPSDAAAVLGRREDPHRAGRRARRGEHRRAVPARGDRLVDVLRLVEGVPRRRQAPSRR